MSFTLKWDDVNERHYSNGIDRGVLYLPNGKGVVWNGLKTVEQDRGADTLEALYLDGVKYMDYQTSGELSTIIRALTYPPEFMQFESYGHEEMTGVGYDDQTFDHFGLSFRVKHDKGYRIHILYNLTAVVDARNYDSVSSATTPVEFGWTVTGVPVEVSGFKPTEHYIFDSAKLSPTFFGFVEAVLYGEIDEEAQLPDIGTFVDFIMNWQPYLIMPQPDGIADIVESEEDGDVTDSTVLGFYRKFLNSRLTESGVEGLYTLEE